MAQTMHIKIVYKHHLPLQDYECSQLHSTILTSELYVMFSSNRRRRLSFRNKNNRCVSIHLIGSVVPQTHIIMFMDCTHEEPLEDAAKNLIICQQKLTSCNTNGAP